MQVRTERYWCKDGGMSWVVWLVPKWRARVYYKGSHTCIQASIVTTLQWNQNRFYLILL